MARYIGDQREGTLFIRGTLEDLLPEDSVGRRLWEAIERLDFRDFDALYENDATGRPAVDPRRLVAVWILGLVRQVSSSVAVARLCHTDVEFRWLLGDVPVEKSTLSDFRKAHGELLRGVAAQGLMALVACGLVRGEDIGVDGTMVEAAASRQSNRSRKRLKRELERLERRIEEQWEADEEGECKVEEGSHERLRKRKAQLEQALRTMEEMGKTGNDDRLTLSEPEAPLRKMKNGTFRPGYNVQVVTDLTSGAVLRTEVVEGANDKGQLEAQVKGMVEVLRQVMPQEARGEPERPLGPVKTVTADAQFHQVEALLSLEKEEIRTFIPDTEKTNRRPPGVSEGFVAKAFHYDAVTDTMVCPCGRGLKRRGLSPEQTAVKYEGEARVCRACVHKRECCPRSKTGRTVNRSLYEEELKALADRVASEEGQVMMKARSVTQEGSIGRMKDRLVWQRCRMWGKAGATIEALWRQIAVNLMLLIQVWKPLVYSRLPALVQPAGS